MYPHVVQFETRRQQFELESRLIRERKLAREARTGDRPSLLARIVSTRMARGLPGTTAASER
jgi:hypothetical protein